jgi:glycosyltransferase involved in cell wall biosynthesis
VSAVRSGTNPAEELDTSEVPAISVVIATFDRPAALARCLDSLLAQQTSRPYEIVVVDNHPQSGKTAATVAKYPQVRWYEESIAGLSRARNRGISVARGPVIVATDDDVIAPPDWIERLTEPLFDENLKDVAATTGNCLPWKVETEAELIFEAYGGLQHGHEPAEFDERWMSKWRICFPQLWRIGTTANAAFRASLFRKPAVGLFEITLGAGSPAGAWEDLYGFYRILRAGYKIRYLPEACLKHVHRETMGELSKQLHGYRRGEASFLTLMLVRHHDLRALGQFLIWIPRWRFSLLVKELGRRLTGKRLFPLSLLLSESLAYLRGPWSLWRGIRDSDRP